MLVAADDWKSVSWSTERTRKPAQSSSYRDSRASAWANVSQAAARTARCARPILQTRTPHHRRVGDRQTPQRTLRVSACRLTIFRPKRHEAAGRRFAGRGPQLPLALSCRRGRPGGGLCRGIPRQTTSGGAPRSSGRLKAPRVFLLWLSCSASGMG